MKLFITVVILCATATIAQEMHNFTVFEDLEVPLDSRIISGRPASVGQFPWQVFLKIQLGHQGTVCGGALICESWVLTAAHCIRGARHVILYLGSVNQAQSYEPGRVTAESAQIIVHRNYDPHHINNDVALIKLKQKVNFNDRIKPIRLGSSYVGPNTQLTVSGFGKTRDGGAISPTLNYVQVRSITNRECSKAYGSSFASEILCTIGNPDHGTCQGDSGGPLVQQANGEAVHVGVVSFVAKVGCARGKPAGFARTGSYLNWIKQHVGESCQLL